MRLATIAIGLVLLAGCSAKPMNDLSRTYYPETFSTSKQPQEFAACVHDAWGSRMSATTQPLDSGFRILGGVFGDTLGQVDIKPLNGETAVWFYDGLFLLGNQAGEKQREAVVNCL